ncbi:MAG: hypothetical protein U5P10_12945 [Spirochaetia bacterium]|nr:hypothetical protein [Spirochaetia bacterium]
MDQARTLPQPYYAEGIRTALEQRDTIRSILNEHRTEPLPEGWWPVSVFSTFTDRDTTTVLDGTESGGCATVVKIPVMRKPLICVKQAR